MWLKETELESTSVKLIPMRKDHADDIVRAASDGELWKLWYTSVPHQDNVHAYIDEALRQQSEGLALPFVVVDKVSQKIIGSTRFCTADSKNQRVEIGYTWYSKSYQRSSVNTECKILLLTHAFEILDAIAVQFTTHWHNQASRTAIDRLGAKQDGVIRNHQKMPNGGYRDTVIFSIISSEWPVVKQSLLHKLDR
ncbi:GNAT family N-acetyltransferase [Vibrio maerlii]|uniref:GNAT family N-acetyltransferase n=1 Tax=Vibrio maerlii TaxID=2231648 RepID=UPI000E3B6CB5|nr:GNAT family protein [Vibrio maerlii]